MRKKYTQVEARAMYEKILCLENQIERMFSEWVRDYPSGTHIATITLDKQSVAVTSVHTARRLHHACVVTNTGGDLHIYALPEPKP